jgi:hypothetical protein
LRAGTQGQTDDNAARQTLAIKTNKNDRDDADAICSVVEQPNMRIVPITGVEITGHPVRVHRPLGIRA